MPKLRVAVASTYPPIHCGVGEYTRMLFTAMSEREPGLEVVVAAEAGVGGEFRDEVSGALVVPSFRQGDRASLRGILDTLQNHGPVDVLHVQHEYGIFGRTDYIVSIASEARREGLARAVVFTMHTVYHPLTADHGEDDVQDAVLSEADAVIVHSVQQEFELHAQLGGYPLNLYRIPHGTSVNPYLSMPRRRIASRLGLSKSIRGRLVLSLVGFIRPDKGLDTLLEALEAIDEGGRLAVIVGGEVRDPGLSRHLEEAERYGLVVIPRYLSTEEILMIAALSDAIVLPYRDPPGKYAVSGILHLSMGSLKPIVGSNVPRLAELYTLAPRLVFRAGDPWDLARHIESLLNPATYDLLVTYASPLYSYAVRTSWPRVAGRHLNLYRRILGRAS